MTNAQQHQEILNRIKNITKSDITSFFKTHFSDFQEDLKDEDFEIMIVQDDTFEQKDQNVLDYLEYRMISYDNAEILEMINS